MKGFKGTPGPWTGKDMFRGVVLSGEGLSLSCGFSSEEAKANGKLALADPDLLEALQNIVKEAKNPKGEMYDLLIIIGEAQAAISKSLGEE